jgi:hypothetical protein
MIACIVSVCGWGQVLENQLPESYVAVLRSNIETRKTAVIQQSLAIIDITG